MNTTLAEPAEDAIRQTLHSVAECVSRSDFPAARQALDGALARTPTDPTLLSTRGRVFLCLNEQEAARADFAAALRYSPKFAAAHSGLAHFHLRREQIHQAEAEARRALELHPADKDATAALTEALARSQGSAAPTAPAPAELGEVYTSCHYIENAIIFHPRTLYHCCIPVNGRFGSTKMCDYQGGPLPIDKIIESRNWYRRMLANPETEKTLHCHGCIHQKKQAWKSKYLFNNLHFNQSMLCNLDCNFCVQRTMDIKSQTSDYKMLPVVEQMVKSQWLAPDAYIFWAGGEPTLLKDFDQSIRTAAEHGTRNEIASNGVIFSQAVFDHLRPGSKLIIKVSIDCGTEETWVRMKGKKVFHKVWANLAKYATTGGEVSAKYIISHDNTAQVDLDGFLGLMKLHKIRYAHIDINHNFTPAEVKPEYISAAVYLKNKLEADGVQVSCGVHSLASVPDFNKRVHSARKAAAPAGPPVTLRPALFNQTGRKPVAVAPEAATPAPVFMRGRASAPAVSPAPQERSSCCCGPTAGQPLPPAVNLSTPLSNATDGPRAALDQFYASANDYFADVVPPDLAEKHLRHSRILSNRNAILPLMPKGGVCAEIGTQTGGFAKQILSVLAPKKLHIFDLDYSLFDQAHFREAVGQGRVELHQGDSSALLATLPDRSFDFIYVDGDHSYGGVTRDLAQAARKIKDGGWIVCNDYTIYSPLEKTKYGIHRAVNEFCLERNYEILYFALHPWGYHDVALRKITSTGNQHHV